MAANLESKALAAETLFGSIVTDFLGFLGGVGGRLASLEVFTFLMCSRKQLLQRT